MQSIYFQRNDFTVEGTWSPTCVHLHIHTPTQKTFSILAQKQQEEDASYTLNLWNYECSMWNTHTPHHIERTLHFTEHCSAAEHATFEQWLAYYEKDLSQALCPHEMENTLFATDWKFFQTHSEAQEANIEALSHLVRYKSSSTDSGTLERLLLLAQGTLDVFDRPLLERPLAFCNPNNHPLSAFFANTHAQIVALRAPALLPQFAQLHPLLQKSDLHQEDALQVSALFFDRLLEQCSFFNPNTPRLSFLHHNTQEIDPIQKAIFDVLDPSWQLAQRAPAAHNAPQVDLLSRFALLTHNPHTYASLIQKGASITNIYEQVCYVLDEMHSHDYQSVFDRTSLIESFASFLAHSAPTHGAQFITFFSHYFEKKDAHLKDLEEQLTQIESPKKKKNTPKASHPVLTLSEHIEQTQYQISSAQHMLKMSVSRLVQQLDLEPFEALASHAQHATSLVKGLFVEGAAQGFFNVLKDIPPEELWSQLGGAPSSHHPSVSLEHLQKSCSWVHTLGSSLQNNNPLREAPPYQNPHTNHIVPHSLFFYTFLWTAIDQHMPEHPNVYLPSAPSLHIEPHSFFDAFVKMRSLRAARVGYPLELTHIHILQAAGIEEAKILHYAQEQPSETLSSGALSYLEQHTLQDLLPARSVPKKTKGL